MMRNWGILIACFAAVGCEPPEEELGPDPDVEIVPDDGKYDSASAGQWAGNPLEHDPGPNESWAQLFAKVPSYRVISRQLGAQWLLPGADGKTKYQTVNEARALQSPPQEPIPQYTLTSDKFRFEMGPLFYRGRLDGTARVLVVGQDAATDEALAHRTFIGGTGQKVQNFLNMIGITKSYVAMNTFIYSIFEQYDEFTRELATSTEIKNYRNQLFKKVWDENKIEVIVSFGSAAHESVRIFRDEMLGGKLPSNVVWVQCLHPGSAGIPDPANPDPAQINQAALQLVADSFSRGWKKVWDYKYSHSGWLKPDSDGIKSKWTKFYYRGTDIPYRDLPFGISREVGRGGTKSERAQSGLQVQLRSLAGVRYAAPPVAYPYTSDKAHSGYVPGTGELAWEPAKLNPGKFDVGPKKEVAELLAMSPPLSTVAAETGVVVANDFHQPVWLRGQTDGTAQIVALGDDDGVDALFAGRALVGDQGQKIQTFFNNFGVTQYLAIDVTPYVTANLADEDVAKLSASPTLTAYRNNLLAQLIPTTAKVILLVGPNAQAAWAAAALKTTATVVSVDLPLDKLAVPSWNLALTAVKPLFPASTPKNYSKTTFGGLRASVPRTDLPWGVPLWLGSSGDLSQQADEHWVFWNAPKWVGREPAM